MQQPGAVHIVINLSMQPCRYGEPVKRTNYACVCICCRYFDYGMFALIMLNCVAMAYEYPSMDKHALDGQILWWRYGRVEC